MDKNQGESTSIEELYLKEKKKSGILMGSTTLLAVLLVGSFLIGGDSTATELAEDGTAAIGQPEGFQQRGQGGFGGPGGGPGGQGVANYLNDDGSVNTDAIAQMTERAAQFGGDSNQFTARFDTQIDTALSSGEISDAQAAALKQAFGL